MTDELSMAFAWGPVLIFVARLVDVSLGTIRMICVTRGQRLAAVVLGFFEILVWIAAVSQVIGHLGQLSNMLAYAGGFAVGNALGMWIETRIAMGVQTVCLVSRGTSNAVAETLRFADFQVTTLHGNGCDGPVAIATVVLPRRQTATAIRLARQVDPDLVVTVEDVRESSVVRTAPYGGGKSPLAATAIGLRRAGLRPFFRKTPRAKEGVGCARAEAP